MVLRLMAQKGPRRNFKLKSDNLCPNKHLASIRVNVQNRWASAGEAEMRLGTKVRGLPTEWWLERAVRWVMGRLASVYRKFFNATPGERSEKGKKIDETKVGLDNYHPQHPDQILVARHTLSLTAIIRYL